MEKKKAMDRDKQEKLAFLFLQVWIKFGGTVNNDLFFALVDVANEFFKVKDKDIKIFD